jgi:glycine cleavage system aminomethyltransferase T
MHALRRQRPGIESGSARDGEGIAGLVLEGPPPPVGSLLVRDGKEAGLVTTLAHAFGAGGSAALGIVRREWWEPGTELAVRHGHAVTIARVAAFPLA